jgi:hypothetical protein
MAAKVLAGVSTETKVNSDLRKTSLKKWRSAPPGSFRPMALLDRPENAMIELQTTVLRDAKASANRGFVDPRPEWRQPDPDVWFTSNGEYATLPQCSEQQLDPRTTQNKWDSRHQISFTRINHLAPAGMRSYFDRMVPSVSLRDLTLAYPNIHDREPKYTDGQNGAEAADELRMSKCIKDISECEKRKTLPITWKLHVDMPTKKDYAQRAAGPHIDKRYTRMDPDRNHRTNEQALKSADYKHPKAWDSSHAIMQSRMAETTPLGMRCYFDRHVDVPPMGGTPKLTAEPPVCTWDLRELNVTREEKHRRNLEAIRKSGIPKRPEKFHGGEWQI